MLRFAAAVVTFALVTLGGAAVTATPAAAAISPPSGCRYFMTSFGQTCYEWEGDDQWVRDLDPNGWTTIVEVETNYGKFRECAAPAAADGWRECGYDHEEKKCVRFRLVERTGVSTNRVSNWSLFYSTSTGNECGFDT
ncbi:hypothetical protein GCM10009745_48940 [Kribbella yunnanensis]|uniref:Uncharacterized protein n=1 Tax=Kribbella yunnanensis TaxID=190194 RepID=A0ABP4U0J1_9ACTN